MPHLVHFLGPEGTFAHAAALSRFGPSAADAASQPTASRRSSSTLVPSQSVLDVFETVADNPNDYGVVPIENSIEGSVSLTLEALADERSPKVIGEIVVQVEQCLLSCGTMSEVRSVMSHPHGLAQCKHWLREHLPHAERVTTASTAAAAFLVSGKPHAAAVASELAGRLAGLKVLARGIQDGKRNATRFVVLGYDLPKPTGNDKTSILFDTPHEQGALHAVLGVFERHGINLSRIESRPMPGELWHYIFYADLEGHCDDPNVRQALDELRGKLHNVKVLGSYPRAASPS